MRLKFVLLVLLQVVLLIGIIAYRQYWVATGDRILLRTVPVDPRDIFRGDYVNLRYNISALDLDELGVKESFKGNEKIYVILEKNPDHTFHAKAVSRSLPMGKKFIQGRVQYEMVSSKWDIEVKDDSGNFHPLKPPWFGHVRKGDRLTFCLDERRNVVNSYKDDAEYRPKCRGQSVTGIVEAIKETRSRVLNVEYGIESYFVEEGKGKEIESRRGTEELKVEVSLRKDGKGIITALHMNGK